MQTVKRIKGFYIPSGVQPGFLFLPLGFGISKEDFLCMQLAKILFLLFSWFGFAWAKMWNFSLVQRSHFSLTGENGAPRSIISQVTVLSIPLFFISWMYWLKDV